MLDEKKFKARLIEQGLTLTDVAKDIGINEATLYRKIKGKSDFFRNELSIIKKKLALSNDDFEAIFFAS